MRNLWIVSSLLRLFGFCGAYDDLRVHIDNTSPPKLERVGDAPV